MRYILISPIKVVTIYHISQKWNPLFSSRQLTYKAIFAISFLCGVCSPTPSPSSPHFGINRVRRQVFFNGVGQRDNPQQPPRVLRIPRISTEELQKVVERATVEVDRRLGTLEKGIYENGEYGFIRMSNRKFLFLRWWKYDLKGPLAERLYNMYKLLSCKVW